MGSLFLNGLNSDARKTLIGKLLDGQNGKCFICEKKIDQHLHGATIDIDHVEPLKTGGRDDPSNFAATHAACNRSKQASDLRVARVLARFASIRTTLEAEGRPPNLNDVLQAFGGAKYELRMRRVGDGVEVSLAEGGDSSIRQMPVYKDMLSGLEYFFAELPITYLFHDDRINPRAIGGSLNGLVEEFHKKRPQLHVCLAWADLEGNEGSTPIRVFDGQHKATAQVLLGARRLPVRIFLNPDPDVLLTTNTNAGTTLRQVAFDKSVQRHLGNALYQDRVERFRKDRGLADDNETFSEKDLVAHFKGERREMQRYILDAVRDSITHNADNRLKDYIEFGGKGKDRPVSYSSVEKTFFSFFIHGEPLPTPLNYRVEEGHNPRELEREQITRLMNLVADNILAHNFDFTLGTNKLESKVQKGEDIPEAHLRSYRMVREEIMHGWLRLVKQIVQNYFITNGKPVQEDRLFQYRFPEPLWENIENFILNLRSLPFWVNRELSLSAFGGKQAPGFWHLVFESGKTPTGQAIMPQGLDLMKMIQPQ
jgi:HNH endonuclease